jgi:amidase
MALSDMWCRLIAPKQVAALEGFKREGIDLKRDHYNDLPPELWHWDEIGRKLTVNDFINDEIMRSDVFDALRKVLDRYDYLVAPTLSCLAVDNATDGNTVGPKEVEGEEINRLIGWCMTFLINFIGYPAATVPAGLASNGLPVGLQIVGRRYADEDVFAASATFERVRPWTQDLRHLRHEIAGDVNERPHPSGRVTIQGGKHVEKVPVVYSIGHRPVCRNGPCR